MKTLELRKKLIEQFDLLIQDDSKLMTLDGVFDAINSEDVDYSSNISEAHYRVVKERRHQYHDGQASVSDWESVKLRLQKKHGL